MTITASTILQTRFGDLRVAYHESDHGACLSFSSGCAVADTPYLLRIHSACMFGEIFASTHCDCGEQIIAALTMMTQAACGVLIYLFQEGRGIGVRDKIRAMDLQRRDSLTTVEAFERLGYAADMRSYALVPDVLHDLGCGRTLHLISNNPQKRQALEDAGYGVERIIPLTYALHPDAREEIVSKITFFGHPITLQQFGLHDLHDNDEEHS